jgi:predicted transcriptional regulator of viral defense system
MGSFSKSTLPKGRAQLATVLGASGDIVHVGDVERILHLPRAEAAKRLSRWMAQGWLHRVGRGAYAPVAIDTLGADQVLSDPWVLVPALFYPGYVGGRTAAEHWDLTEQIFKDIVVVTAKVLRQTHQVRHGAAFTLQHVPAEKIFGTKTVWRHRSRVLVSDVHRTIIDMLDRPDLGGGIQHVADCLAAYLARADRNDALLMQYADRLGNGAVFKRLGFLAERTGDAGQLAEACFSRLTAGVAKLDSALDKQQQRIVARWRLRIPVSWMTAAQT